MIFLRNGASYNDRRDECFMIRDTTINKIIKFNSDRDWGKFHTPENLSKSILIEAAELLENFQWGNEFDVDNIKEELADVLMYSIMLAIKLDLSIDEIILQKLKKNEEKYSVENAKGNSKKYTEFL